MTEGLSTHSHSQQRWQKMLKLRDYSWTGGESKNCTIFCCNPGRSKVQGIQSPAVKGVLHRSQSNQKASKKLIGSILQPSQLKPKIEKELFQGKKNKSVDEPFVQWIDPPEIHIKPQGTWKYLISRITARWRCKGQKEYKIKGDSPHPQVLLAGSRVTIQIQIGSVFHEKGSFRPPK